MFKPALTIALTFGIATAALAHSGVKNEAVKARMMLMGQIKDATGVIGGMAQGKVAFDAEQAAAARDALLAASQKVPDAFKANETDPKSESAETIWTDWDGFLAEATAMQNATAALQTASLDDLRAGIGAIGKSCGGCHKTYRIDK